MKQHYKLIIALLFIGSLNVSCANKEMSEERKLVTSHELSLQEWGCLVTEVTEEPPVHELNCDMEKYKEKLESIDFNEDVEEARYFGDSEESSIESLREGNGISSLALHLHSMNRLEKYVDEMMEIAATEKYEGRKISIFQANNILSKVKALLDYQMKIVGPLHQITLENK